PVAKHFHWSGVATIFAAKVFEVSSQHPQMPNYWLDSDRPYSIGSAEAHTLSTLIHNPPRNRSSTVYLFASTRCEPSTRPTFTKALLELHTNDETLYSGMRLLSLAVRPGSNLPVSRSRLVFKNVTLSQPHVTRRPGHSDWRLPT